MFGLGLLLSHLLPDTPLATYTYILVSYHLVLGIRIAMSDKKAGLSLPWSQTILTHLACVGLLVGLAMGRHTIPFFGFIRLFMPGLAPFEASWLFSGETVKIARLTDLEAIESATLAPALKQAESGDKPAAVATAGAATALAASTTGMAGLASKSSGEDYDEFLKLMQQGKRPFRRPGISVMQEYELWLAHRQKPGVPLTESAKA